MSKIERVVIRAWGFILIALGVVIGWHLHSALPPPLTADQLYGCTVAQQAPNGECK